MIDKMIDKCIVCGIPRSCYDLTIEPGISNPDWNLGQCAYGHLWGKEIIVEENSNDK